MIMQGTLNIRFLFWHNPALCEYLRCGAEDIFQSGQRRGIYFQKRYGSGSEDVHDIIHDL